MDAVSPETHVAPDATSGGKSGGIIGWFRRTWTDRPLPLDVAVYAACLGYAGVQAATSEFYGFRVWGNCALAGYGIALLHSVWLLLRSRSSSRPRGPWHSRWVGVTAVGALAMLLPLVILVVRRLTGGAWHGPPSAWSAQPEVWVIEHAADVLLSTGTPYLDITELARTPGVYDYTPYGPVMSLFGLPDALAAHGPVTSALTDARLYFALTAVGCAIGCVKLLGIRRVPIRAAQLAVVCPLTALTWAVAGPDLAVLGLILLGTVLADRRRTAAAAAVIAVVVSAKLIALPAAVVLGVLTFATRGSRAGWGFVGTFAGAFAAVNVPVFLVNQQAYVEHVIRFPLGLAQVESPAASPLPGHLLAELGTAGHTAALAVLGCAGVVITGWLLWRPPRTAADAALRLAVGLATFTLLAPATRFGYLVYPTVLLGAMVYFRQRPATAHEDVTVSCRE